MQAKFTRGMRLMVFWSVLTSRDPWTAKNGTLLPLALGKAQADFVFFYAFLYGTDKTCNASLV